MDEWFDLNISDFSNTKLVCKWGPTHEQLTDSCSIISNANQTEDK